MPTNPTNASPRLRALAVNKAISNCVATACRIVAFALAASSLVSSSLRAQDTPRFTIRTQVSGNWIEGTPLYWSEKKVQLLCRDGMLRSFAPGDAKNSSKSSDSFHSYTAGEVRTQLQREFGARFEVSGTGHYLVVHPAGQRDAWAERFEQLYRSFVVYFSVRGLKVSEPEFPLVAIVVPRREEMVAYSAREGMPVPNGVLGYYSPMSNRVILYDQENEAARTSPVSAKTDNSAKANKQNKAKHWSDNNDTIIHEATHQTAFNTGIHRRWPSPPAWVAEGLGTMFEAPGVWDSQRNPNRPERINRGRLDNYKQIAARVNGGVLADIVASDRNFQSNPAAAYAIAWAMTFYLVETQPGKYRDYLARTARHTSAEGPTDKERLADFTAVFGDDFSMFHARFQRFMADVK